MGELRPVRALSIEKMRNLWRNAQLALKDARAPAEYVSAPRRFDAAYDCAMACALALLESSKLEVVGLGHHQDAMNFMVKTLALRGQTAQAVPVMIRARNSVRYDAMPLVNEQVVTSAIDWADRILAETEAWLQANQPLALKN